MLETKRTFLRPIKTTDNKDVFSYRSDSITNKYQSWIPQNLDEVNAFISKNPKEINIPDTWYQMVIVDKTSNEIIGDIGLHFIGNCQAELGITIRKERQNKGYANECISCIIDYLFNHLQKHRITTSIDPRNSYSIYLVESLGLRKEAHFKKSLFLNGEWVDDMIYAILKTDWE